MKQPLFSIIIPTYNEEKFLPQLLDSLIVQTERNFEIIVVDGPSKDRTKLIAKSYKKKLPISLVESKKGNLPLQRNLGAAKAHGAWYVFVDADSVLLPHFISRCKAFIASQKPQLFTTWCSPDSDVNSDAIITLLINFMWDGSAMVRRQIAPGPLSVMTKEAFERVGGYNEERLWGEDYDIAQRLYKLGIKLQVCRETLFKISLRRFRKEGNLKALQMYANTALLTLITKSPPQNVRGYIMGGHFYKHKPKRSVLKTYERKLKMLMKELFT